MELQWWSQWRAEGGRVSTCALLLLLRWGEGGGAIMGFGESPCPHHPGLSDYKSHCSERVSRAQVFHVECKMFSCPWKPLNSEAKPWGRLLASTWYSWSGCFKGPILYPFFFFDFLSHHCHSNNQSLSGTHFVFCLHPTAKHWFGFYCYWWRRRSRSDSWGELLARNSKRWIFSF